MEHNFTVNNEEFMDYRRSVTTSSDAGESPAMTPRAGGRKMSARDMRQPTDLTRSRRVGLSRDECVNCSAPRGPEGFSTHKPGCTIKTMADPAGMTHWTRKTTGPLRTDQTSIDTGYRVR